jgi:hypothetical protein
MNGYYITENNPTVKVPLEPQEETILFSKEIIELILPKCERVYCWNNYLTELTIPEGVKLISCEYNKLEELILPKSIKYINCRFNTLSKLIISKNCDYIECYSNNLPLIIIDLLQSKDPIKIELANSLQLANNLPLTNNQYIK